MKISNSNASAVIVFLLTLAGSNGGAAPAANATGHTVVQKLYTVFSDWNSGAKSQNVFGQVDQYIDYNGMAEAALEPSQWNSMNSGQKQQYIASFRKLVEDRYYERWHKIFAHSKLTFGSEATQGQDTYVTTYLTSPKTEEQDIIWRLHPEGGTLKVISLNVDNKDLVGRIGPRLQKVFQKHGSYGLVQWLTAKAKNPSSETE